MQTAQNSSVQIFPYAFFFYSSSAQTFGLSGNTIIPYPFSTESFCINASVPAAFWYSISSLYSGITQYMLICVSSSVRNMLIFSCNAPSIAPQSFVLSSYGTQSAEFGSVCPQPSHVFEFVRKSCQIFHQPHRPPKAVRHIRICFISCQNIHSAGRNSSSSARSNPYISAEIPAAASSASRSSLWYTAHENPSSWVLSSRKHSHSEIRNLSPRYTLVTRCGNSPSMC